MLKSWRLPLAILTISFLLPIAANAQSIVGGTGIAGIQSSNLNGGTGMGTYLALRGGVGNIYGEYRMAHFGSSLNSSGASLDETGYLAGYKLSLFGLDLSAGAGLGNSTYKPQSTGGFATTPVTYQSLVYEAQAVYNFPILTSFIKAGVGVNAVGETSSQQPVFGVGAIATLSVGF